MKRSILRGLIGPSAALPRDPQEPIRSELFRIERLEQHGDSLAAAPPITSRPGRGRPLARRSRDNGHVLLGAYRAIAAAIREERAITPAAEWLVDNFHVVEEQIREIQDDLPRGFYRQLPKLREGPLAGYPRVFGLAWAFVAHTDSLDEPAALASAAPLSNRVGAGLDPCGALQSRLEIEPKDVVEIVFLLGEAPTQHPDLPVHIGPGKDGAYLG